MAQKRLLNLGKYLLFVGIALGLLYLAFRNNDPQKMWNDLKRADYSWVIAGMLCGYLAFVFRGLRWRLLLEPSGYQTSAGNAINAVAVGYLANLAVPRLGEITRCTAMNRVEKIPVDNLFGTVLAERVIDLLMLGGCFVLVLILKMEHLLDLIARGESGRADKSNLLIWFFVALALISLVMYFSRKLWMKWSISQKIMSFLKGVGQGILSVIRLEKRLLFAVYTLLIWLMYFLMSYLYFFCLPETFHLGMADGLFVMMAGSLGIIAPAPGGIGAFHAMVIAGLVTLGIDDNSAGSLAIIVHSSQTLMTLITGSLALILLSLAGKKAHNGIL